MRGERLHGCVLFAIFAPDCRERKKKLGTDGICFVRGVGGRGRGVDREEEEERRRRSEVGELDDSCPRP